MAGVVAAKTLHEMGHDNFIILEATDRIGGRSREVHLGGYTLEAGSMYIHGLGNNPLYKMAQDYNMSYVTTNYDDVIVYDEVGNDVTDQFDAAYEVFEVASEKLAKERKAMQEMQKPDTTLRQLFVSAGWFPNTSIDDAVEFYEYDFDVSHSPDSISAKFGSSSTSYEAFNSSVGADVTIKDERGYSFLHRSLLSEVMDIHNDTRLIFNQTVTNIEQNSSHVIIYTANNNQYVGAYVISTFSVGVMQNRLVNFDPPLPKWKLESIDQFQMGAYHHMFFQFPLKFWDDNEFILYVSSRRGYYTLWRNINKLHPGSNILQVTLLGNEARRTTRLTDTAIKNEVLAALQKMYIKKNIVIPEPIGYVIPRWLSDPLFKGSYVNWTPGYTIDTHEGLCAAVGRFYFAGEACLVNFEGYLHGAYFSGKSTAEDIIKCLNDKSKCTNYIPEYLSRGCTYVESMNYRPGLKSDDGSCTFSPCKTSSAHHVSPELRNLLCFVLVVYFIEVILLKCKTFSD